jgi:ribosomal protein S14
MRYLNLKDQFKRHKQKRMEVKRNLVNCLKNNFLYTSRVLSLKIRSGETSRRQIKELDETSNTSKILNTRLKNILHSVPKSNLFSSHHRCIATKRSRAVYRFFGLERRILRKKFRGGLIPAVQRILWG